ncbi:unnamed protein product, partial [Musa textilis]
ASGFLYEGKLLWPPKVVDPLISPVGARPLGCFSSCCLLECCHPQT